MHEETGSYGSYCQRLREKTLCPSLRLRAVWFELRRLRDDYVPTGFKPYRAKTYAVKGHLFGLDLSAEHKKALIAFLKTL
jgi:hypothetical protein